MTRTITSVLSLAMLLFFAAGPSLACDAAGPNTHVGVVTAVDAAKKTFTLKDAQTGKPLTFAATPEQLQGLRVKDEVSVVYAAEGEKLRAATIKKS
jgi:hypothetical protein